MAVSSYIDYLLRIVATYIEIPLQKTKGYKAYSLNEQFVLFHSTNHSLYVLSDYAAWLFLSLDAGYSKAEITKELSVSGVEAQQLDSAYQELEQVSESTSNNATYRNEYADLAALGCHKKPDFPAIYSVFLLGKTFCVHSSCTQLTKFFQRFLPTDSHTNSQSDQSKYLFSDFHLIIDMIGDHYRLSCNGQLIAKIPQYAYIIPVLMDYLQILAYQSSNYLLAVHSAMLAYQGRGIMLPGISGSGKSTLSLSLINQGFQCYSDEISVVSIENNLLMPLPLPVAIKSGSWEIIRPDFPNVDSLPIWERADGRRLKYLELPFTHQSLPHVPLEYIVFPHYQEGVDGYELTPINAIDSLQSLITAGYQVKDDLTKNKVEQILNLVSNTPSYHLTYSSLEQAHSAIHQLMKVV